MTCLKKNSTSSHRRGVIAVFSRIRNNLSRALALTVVLLLAASGAADAARTARGKKAMAATAHPDASKVAAQVMREGGNAADAFVAAALVLGVVEPYSAGLGGGGFALYQDKTGKVRAYDFRERAPGKATRDMYKVEGKVDPMLSKFGPLAVGVPGQPAGLEFIHKAHGKLPLARLTREAHAFATDGFEVFDYLHGKIRKTKALLEQNEASRKIWLPEGKVPEVGRKIKQPGLARSLERFAKQGAKPFYEGPIAKALATEVKRLGGLISEKDLKAYKVHEVAPVRGTFRDWEVYSFPGPSSGGIVLVEMLNMLEAALPEQQEVESALKVEAGLKKLAPLAPLLSATAVGESPGYEGIPALQSMLLAGHSHLLAEVMRRGYADRAEYLGDPRFADVPTKRLIDKRYAKQRLEGLSLQKAEDVSAGSVTIAPTEGEHTTHISIVGPEGDAVSATLTINLSFGSGITVPGWGIILNNEMDDFAAAPGVPNAFGLIQGERNAIEPGKTPLSSMTPTLAYRGGKLRYVLGTPGGSRIISTVLQLFINVAAFGMSPEQAMDAPRLHHQWRPNSLYAEKAFFAPKGMDALKDALESMGHEIKTAPSWCNAQAVWVEEGGGLLGLSDERVAGAPAGF